MDQLFAELIFKIHDYRLLKFKSKNRNNQTYDFSGLLSIVDEDFSA